MTEEWRLIESFPDYTISTIGNVKRVVRDQKGRLSGKCLKLLSDADGYFQVNLFRDSLAHTRKVHRLVCLAFHGLPPTVVHEVAHADGSRTNNHADNLRWATEKENADDRELHGRTARGDRHGSRTHPFALPTGQMHWSQRYPEKTSKGERHGCSKLTSQDVKKIRSDHRLLQDIATVYGVTPTTICHIKNRKTWRHVE